MARIPDGELERLKAEVSLVRLAEARGIELKRHGADLHGRCPFHDDKTPSLVITPSKNLWHCLGACQAGGSVVDWVMRSEGVSFRHAVELLRSDYRPDPDAGAVKRSSIPKLPAPIAYDADDAALLRQVVDYYHATLKQSPEALAYLKARGIHDPNAIERFQLGFANRTLGLRLPEKNRQAGALIRSRLQTLGLVRESGHEHFNGSLVIPIVDAQGQVRGMYGRKITRTLHAGTPLHLYLPGPHRGVWNVTGIEGQEEVILCEALIDALTFWCAGYRNVTASYGVEGFTADHLDAFRQHGTKRVLIAYDRDDAGDKAAVKLAQRLTSEGLDCYRIQFPKGMDANDYALKVQPATKSFGVAIRSAEWMGQGKAKPRPDVEPVSIELPTRAPADSVSSFSSSSLAAIAAEAAKEKISPAPDPAPEPEGPAYRVPPSAPALEAQADALELRLVLGERMYRVRGLDKNLSYDSLKVTVRVTAGDTFHVDTLDLCAAKQRQGWVKQASIELGISEDVLKADLGKLLSACEARQDELIRKTLRKNGDSETPAKVLSEAERDEALVFLQSPDLMARIVGDFERVGLVGEPTNALVGYLAAVSRKLKTPLALIVQSTSAAGKSALMEAVLNLVPEEDRVHYSAMTGQSLFYLGESDLKHKLLAIAEEEGVRQAAYALKLLQSQGELTIASTGKDPATGRLVTEEYRVEGPVMLFLTTTAIDLDEELLNRCLVLTVNESREQTRRIQQRQRMSRTLEGLLARSEAEAITTLHRNAQRLLRPLAVVNPFAERLGFLDDRTRTRRDHQKYLTLIDVIALLHQHQRPVRSVTHRGEAIDYIEVTASDIALANQLAHEVLGRSLDELPPQTRRVLGGISALVQEQCQARSIERKDFRFSRRELRTATALSDTQLRVHLERLTAMEYVLVHRGARGQSFVYELTYDGDASDSAPRLPGLIDVDSTPTTANLAGVNGDLAGSTRPQNGANAGGVRGGEIPVSPSVHSVSSSLAAASAETAPLGTPRAERRNRSHTLAAVR